MPLAVILTVLTLVKLALGNLPRNTPSPLVQKPFVYYNDSIGSLVQLLGPLEAAFLWVGKAWSFPLTAGGSCFSHWFYFMKAKGLIMSKPLKQIELFTDGACSGNPGPGGYGAILRYNGHEKELSGGEGSTTNNRMELTAAIVGLESLKEPCQVTLYSDSKYLIDAITQRWVYKWKANGWMRNKKDPALNPDLWERLLTQLERHQVSFIWVKGHAGHPENERCDALAVAQAAKYK